MIVALGTPYSHASIRKILAPIRVRTPDWQVSVLSTTIPSGFKGWMPILTVKYKLSSTQGAGLKCSHLQYHVNRAITNLTYACVYKEIIQWPE
jgi:hypothetical protein